MVQIFNIDDLATEVITTSNNLVNTSNNLLNRITDLYTKDITFQENVTVSGDLAVNGAKTSTKILEIANDSQNITPLLKIDDNSSADRNIIELYKQDIEVFSIDNSGKLSTSIMLISFIPRLQRSDCSWELVINIYKARNDLHFGCLVLWVNLLILKRGFGTIK